MDGLSGFKIPVETGTTPEAVFETVRVLIARKKRDVKCRFRIGHFFRTKVPERRILTANVTKLLQKNSLTLYTNIYRL